MQGHCQTPSMVSLDTAWPQGSLERPSRDVFEAGSLHYPIAAESRDTGRSRHSLVSLAPVSLSTGRTAAKVGFANLTETGVCS